MFNTRRIQNTDNKKFSIFFITFITTFVTIIIILFFIYNGYSNFKTNTLIENQIIIEIKKGEVPSNLAKKLNISEKYLKLYLKKNNPDFELIIGKFKIEENSNIKQIIEQLKEPIIEDEVNITILEGWNIYDTDEYLTNKKLINKGEYIKYVKNNEKIEKLAEFFPFIKGLESLEGFLYPDTYKVVSSGFKINTFVIKQLENFENKIYNNILSKLNNKEIKDLITLASIVEKEEKNITAKPTVAGILKKRLNNGWMIGADITVCYPYELTSQECKMVVSKYINKKNNYNTRTMTGLPKTAIGNPSFETVNATLNSKQTEYWFYLHNTSSGKIYYGKNNAEHEKNKRLYLR